MGINDDVEVYIWEVTVREECEAHGFDQEVYSSWRHAFRMYLWSLVIQVKRCWDRLKNWLAANFPEVLGTVRNGASEEEIKTLEVTLQVKLPLPARVLYRFCDGQGLDVDDSSGSVEKSLFGLIGGYSFYRHLVNVFLLPPLIITFGECIMGLSND
ncbi:OLC1v1008224C1 [Oldenlandia corymbosa var. corymbosa]|uniref:OLC1v1008224C1 n=1 Tax=Oldenlandia corymbosa var. corymbosa TaxID=529605 RepID=A0AAV1DL11_OLDCO|nr:OLC1v1008224C1 [Oldenlandia corymbosa var. corymbosa]